MKKEREIENDIQTTFDVMLGIKPTQQDDEEIETKKPQKAKDGKILNDAGDEISVENGYSPADVEELERLALEEDEKVL